MGKLHVILLGAAVIVNLHNCCCEVTVKQATPPVQHGEGPHWDEETQALYFVDIEGEQINRYDPIKDSVTHANLPGGGVSMVIPVKGSAARQFIATRGHDVVLVDWNNKENATFDKLTSSANISIITSVEQDEKHSGTRWNDGKADARGRLWAGTIGPEPIVGHVVPDQASLYMLDVNSKEVKIVVTPISISNGIAWNSDNTLMYYIDTATYQVDVFDFDLEAGTISNRRKVFNLQENNVPGLPDGMTIDNNENLWIACFNGGRVINVNPRDGSLLRTVMIPATRTASVTFGGCNLDVLYVATSRYGLTDNELALQPMAGSVFSVTGLGVTALKPAYNVVRRD